MYKHIKKDRTATKKQIRQIKELIQEYDTPRIKHDEYLGNVFVGKVKYITKCEDKYFDFNDDVLEDKYYELKLAFDRNKYGRDAPPYKTYSEITS